MNTLEKLRGKISEIDLKLIELISQRAEVALDIAKEKRQSSGPLYRPSREQSIFLSIDQNNKGPLNNTHLHNIYREIMSAALSIEGKLNVAYFGLEGSFTHQAALKKFGHSLKLLSYPDVNGVFEAVQKGDSQFGVLPVENSTAGKVTSTLDTLLEYDLSIYSEVHLSVHHYLLGLSGSAAKLGDIKKVYTHPQARSQCQKWLSKNLPHAEWIETSSTSQAAQIVASQKSNTDAAIASLAASEVYKLSVIRETIEDAKKNFTRFIIISKDASEPGQKDRTTVVFSLPHKPGSLHEILSMISQHNVNLTSIESRPDKTEMWNYIFYLDLEGHEEQEPVKKLLEMIQTKTSFFRVLGSYPIDVTYL